MFVHITKICVLSDILLKNSALKVKGPCVFLRIIWIILLLILAAFPESSLTAQDGEEKEETIVEFKYKGLISFENVIDVKKEQETKEAFKKNELRHNFNIQYGTFYTYIKMDANLYAIPYFADNKLNNEYLYSQEDKVYRNLRYSSKSYEANFRELFLNITLGEYFRLRLGNQIFAWGKSDAVNPTSYFNPFDLRELLLKGDDEMRQAIPAASIFLSFGSHSLDLVFAPVHVPRLLPEKDSYWELKYKIGFINVDIETSEGMDIKPENFGYGARYSTSLENLDIELSYYHGPDKDPVLRPISAFDIPVPQLSDFVVVVKEEYYLINSAGFSFSWVWDDLTLQGEAAYTFDKTVTVEQEIAVDMVFPYEVKKSPYYSYSVGFNYFIPFLTGDTILSAAWSQSRYLDDQVMQSVLSKAVMVQLSDELFQGHIKPSLTGVMETKEKSYIIIPSLKYDLLNGLDFVLGFLYINGKPDTLFGIYDNRKIVTFTVNYAF